MNSRTLQLSNVPEQDGWGIILSLVMHGLLLLAVVLYQQFFTSSRQVFTPNYQSVSLVGSAPTAQAPAPAPPKPAPKPEPAPPKPAPTPPKPAAEPIASKPQPEQPAKPAAKPEVQPRPDSSREIEQRLQALQREQEQRRAREAEAERQRQAREAEAQRQRQEQQALDNAISRLEQQTMANAGSPGRAGGTPSQIDPRLQAYNQQLHDLIHRNWVVPDGINTRGLVVVINFNIRRDGSAERIWVEQSSGNPVYDQSGLRAAEKAAPFPPPPSVIRSPIYEVGIRFTYD